MKPEDIIIKTQSKAFHYEILSREIENCNDLNALKNQLRLWIKLYMKQQETLTQLGNPERT